ncbi:uracil-DNA glycosylase [Gracilibacillus xinjiangensis]|uniref:Uracil-DNA glycosylase n=1 Tax=Gracilibacillus xinjiangensis TaxID=1193282 RepID=A0ABV8WPJ5_9BACI
MSKTILKNDWANILDQEFDKEYYIHLREFLKREYQQFPIYPDREDIFNALHYTPFENVKVVILGQDPYHGPDQAHGLSFSVKPEVEIPPSLRNIYKELAEDVGCTIPNHGHLTKWAEQGVLLLNNVLTVRAGQAHSHRGQGWEQFTDQVIMSLNEKADPIVYILWGAAAQKKQAIINTSKHFIIKSAHPSPLSAHRGFLGSQPFSKTNEILKSIGRNPIDWQIDNV